MNLDVRFGAALRPGGDGIREGEERYRPASLALMGLDVSERVEPNSVIAYMLSVQNGCRISSYLCDSANVLWLVDANGVLRMAVEEAFRETPAFVTIPILSRNRSGSLGWSKLGHPSLLDSKDKEARIGGEIRYVRGTWLLTNESGRYGRLADRSHGHLRSVASVLAGHGIRIDTDFL